MEDEVDEFSLEDHKDRCRLCLDLFTESDVFYELNEVILLRFGLLTSIELNPDAEEFSSIICATCNRNLSKYIALRDDFIRKQKKLYNFVFGEEFPNVAGIEEKIQEVKDDLLEIFSDPEFLEVENEENEFYEEQIPLESLACEELEIQDSDEHQYEYLISPASKPNFDSSSCLTNDEGRKKIMRPKAWTWTTEMELDLIRYRNKWKREKASDTSVYKKISKKFEAKGYPKILGKSIKYKYEKLVMETDKLQQLQAQAAADPVDSEDDLYIVKEPVRKKQKRKSTNKTYSAWSQEKEVMLLYHISRNKQLQPAISDNQLYKIVIKEMKCEGYSYITEHIIQYHLKKLRQDSARYKHLFMLASKLQARQEEKVVASTAWSKSADDALLTYKKNLDSQTPTLKLSEMWQSVKYHLEFCGHGSFSDRDIRNRFDMLIRNRETDDEMDSLDSEAKAESSNESRDDIKSGTKRRYLYWTEEMKQSLIKHRNDLKKSVPDRELWSNVAKRMESDGFGTFTAQNVMYKYFNLKRQTGKPPTDRSVYSNPDVDED